MAGRAHANGYRSAPALFDTDLPEVRLVAIADAHEPFAVDTARRYGYQRAETSWEAIAEASDIDAVSVVVGTALHREIVEALLEAGKHVLCEKPLAPSVADGQEMVERAEKADGVAAVGFTFRWSPAISAIRQRVTEGDLGPVVHFNGHYWCDYGVDPDRPMSWRYKGGPGSGALADIGTHLVDLGEFLCGPVESVRGTISRRWSRTALSPWVSPLGTPLAWRSATSGSRSRTKILRHSPPRSLAVRSAPSPYPESPTGWRTRSASRCSVRAVRPHSISPAWPSSRSLTVRLPVR